MTRSLNLDPMFVPVAAPEIEFNTFIFNGGEVHIRLNQNIDYSKIDRVLITHRIKSSDDIMQILLAVDALYELGINDIDLFIPYLPYARQDRVCVKGEAFSAKVMAGLLNSCNFNKVIIVDPHSEHSFVRIINHKIQDAHMYVEEVLEGLPKDTVLVAPDKGSTGRVTSMGLEMNRPVVQGGKIRDQERGTLTGFTADIPKELKGKPMLIVDDICDGGGTFLGLADELKKQGSGDLYLYVTHGIFSAGFTPLMEKFKHLFCTDSFQDYQSGVDITQLKIRI